MYFKSFIFASMHCPALFSYSVVFRFDEFINKVDSGNKFISLPLITNRTHFPNPFRITVGGKRKSSGRRSSVSQHKNILWKI